MAGSALGGDGSDFLYSIENVKGSAFNDTLTGDGLVNVLIGWDGNDRLTGGAGNDVLQGGSGVDEAAYANAASRVIVNLVTGNASGGDGADTLTSIENASGSSFGDVLAGNGFANMLVGLDGNDTLTGGAGNDILNGGVGFDTAIYSGATSAVSVNLMAQTASGGDGADTLISIDGVKGSAFADTLIGNGEYNNLAGGAGNDLLIGNAGPFGNGGNDVFSGGDGNDVVNAGVGSNLLDGGAGNDLLNAGAGDDVLRGAIGDDTLGGDDGKDTLEGGSGNDSLSGGNDNDKLDGQEGIDVLIGGAGRDGLIGGAGGDFFRFNAVSESVGTSKATRDLVGDFEQGSDKIDLSGIDADTVTGGDQAFTFIGAAAFSGVAGQLRAAAGADATTIVMGDVNGDQVADFQLELVGSYTLTTGDFLL